MMDLIQLIEKIEYIFTHEDNFVMKKVIEEFEIDDKFVGDVYTFLIYEDLKDLPPMIYQVGGPFDLVTKKAPQQALVWQDGKVLLNEVFTDYVDIRTGAMDALVVKQLKREITEDTRVLLFGAGATAYWSIRILKEQFPNLQLVEYINSTRSSNVTFEEKLKEIGVIATPGSYDEISEYDYIFCHTNAKEAVLRNEHIDKIKQGCIISTFLSSTEHGELSDEFFDSNQANIILDWDKNLRKGKDLERALDCGSIGEDDIIAVKDLIKGREIDDSKKFTIFRSLGTPMQNLAVLKLLLED